MLASLLSGASSGIDLATEKGLDTEGSHGRGLDATELDAPVFDWVHKPPECDWTCDEPSSDLG